MKYLIPILLLLLASCNEAKEEKKDQKQQQNSKDSTSNKDTLAKAESDSIVMPSFTIELQLSEEVLAKTYENGETIIVLADFLGDPIDTTIDDYDYQSMGKLPIGSEKIELSNGTSAAFHQVKFAQSTLDQLKSQDIEVSINIYTGRKTVKTNLISCGYIQKKISELNKEKQVISCELI